MRAIQTIGYYRLSAYMRPFRDRQAEWRKADDGMVLYADTGEFSITLPGTLTYSALS